MADETMTLEQVRDSLRRIGAHPNSLFSKWERAIEAAIKEIARMRAQLIEGAPRGLVIEQEGTPRLTAARKVADGWKCVAPPCKCDDRTARVCAYATFPAAPKVMP